MDQILVSLTRVIPLQPEAYDRLLRRAAAYCWLERFKSQISKGASTVSYDEIGEVLNISLGTVKSRILRGRDALRKNLTGRMEPGRVPDWFPQIAD